MEGKRSLSPTSSNYEQAPKRLCEAVAAPDMALKSCLHCGSMLHRWNECTNVCTHCQEMHVHRRCPSLNVAKYTPGGFMMKAQPDHLETKAPIFDPSHDCEVLNASSAGYMVPPQPPTQHTGDAATSYPASLGIFDTSFLDGTRGKTKRIDTPLNGSYTAPGSVENAMIPARAFMIENMPVSSFHSPREFDPALGPKRSGMNNMPLGQKNPQGTSRTSTSQPSAVQISKDPDLIQLGSGLQVSRKVLTENDRPAQVPIDIGSKDSNLIRLRSGRQLSRDALWIQKNPTPAVFGCDSTTPEGKVWTKLVAYVRKAVEDTKAPLKPFNGAGNRKSARERVEISLAVLRPAIFGAKQGELSSSEIAQAAQVPVEMVADGLAVAEGN